MDAGLSPDSAGEMTTLGAYRKIGVVLLPPLSSSKKTLDSQWLSSMLSPSFLNKFEFKLHL